MVREDENPPTAQPGPNTHSVQISPSLSQSRPSDDPRNGRSNTNSNSPLSRNDAQSGEEFISSVASKIAAQPLQYSDPDVWGVLTAISEKARKRHQGMNMLLTSDEHRIGRLVDDARFQIIAPAVSAHHCKIYRKRVVTEDTENPSDNYSVFLKDTSTNGTYLNWEKLNKSSSGAKLRHGDIISIAFVPQHELAFAFVFREVQKSSCVSEGGSLKRKPGKERVERICFKAYLDQLSELNQSLEAKDKELAELKRISAEQKHGIEDLNERLNASMQSCVEANEIISSQKASILELKGLLDEERDQRREEREKASVDMKMAVQRVQAEATEEITRVSECALRREKELQEMINKLQVKIMNLSYECGFSIGELNSDLFIQEAEKERCSLVEILRSKLEDTRQKLVNSDNKVRQLEGQIHQEQQAFASNRKRVEELEHERKRLKKELEREKAAREEAWAKVSALELEISAAMRDLDFERRRLKGARERIMLRETQLRAFYSTTEEISVLFAKQQLQLKAMQRTLEDEENYETTSFDADINPGDGNENRSVVRNKEEAHQSNSIAKAGSGVHHSHGTDQVESSSDEASVTEKHDCNARGQENALETQEVEFTSAEYNVNGGFGSDINGVGTAPILDGDAVGTEQIPETEGVGTSPIFEGNAAETEQVLETESLVIPSGRNLDLNKWSTLDPDAMLVDSTNPQESQQHAEKVYREPSNHSHLNSPVKVQDPMEDTEGGGTIKTADLLASEVAGSWACSTAPSVHGENDSPGSKNYVHGENDTPGSKNYDEESAIPVHDSSSLVAESQNIPLTKSEAAAQRDHERRALSEMIGIVAPDLREQFSRAVASADQVGSERGVASDSDSDTEGCSDNDDRNEAGNQGTSDAETIGSDRAMSGDQMDGDDDTQADSVG
ncbi:UNVERIFIED_CONTAM: hypothetical protein Sradi_1122300 [Sesamum radiatum]|uniref:FHA domain-containing protein n=1 Tax=Sesamum radiatum TaxID=300843 RepID=A0AAW2V806_SESRA